MEKKQNNKKRFNLIAIILIVVVFGFLAGITGEFFTKYYLSNLSFFRDIYFTDMSDLGQREIIIRDPKKVVVEQDLRIEQIKNEIQPAVVAIFKKQQTNENLLDNVFLPQDFLGQAVVLTSDGWLITTDKFINLANSGLVVSYNKRIYEIEKLVKDELSGLVFLKIPAQNLAVVKFAEFSELKDGQLIYVYNAYLNQLNIANIKSKTYQPVITKYDFVNSSESLSKTILINKDFSRDYASAPMMNSQGQLVGFMANTKTINQAIPVNYLRPIISQILKDETIKRPYLGINYLNLNQVFGIAEDDRQGQQEGALIITGKTGTAIEENSPLLDQLVAGDIITSIEDQKITADNDVIDILLEYKTGQQISLKYLHDNQENEISITL